MKLPFSPPIPAHFESNYQRLLNCLKLGGLQPKTIELYSHGVRRAGAYFNYQLNALSKPQLTDYFVHILPCHGDKCVGMFHCIKHLAGIDKFLRLAVTKKQRMVTELSRTKLTHAPH